MLKNLLISLLVAGTIGVTAYEPKEAVTNWRTVPKTDTKVSVYKDTIFARIDGVDKCNDILDGKYNSTDTIVYSVDNLKVKIGQLRVPIGIYTKKTSSYALAVAENNKVFLLKFVMDEGLHGLVKGDTILIGDNVIMDTDGVGTIIVGGYDLIKEI